MYFINSHFTATYEEKQSKFIAHLIPYNLYQTTLQSLKAEHPKARHFVTSYRYLNEFDQIVEHSSDDGEPKGTSGKPTLSVLQGHELINIAVIVVRYFGGTKLGTGGLVRAYSDAVNMAVNLAELILYKKEKTEMISLLYSDIGRVEYECLQLEITIIEKFFDSDVRFKIQAEEETLKTLHTKLERVIVSLS
ncbi:MAG: YigZ family protein [Thiovulaceae bacterium]|nr:YigZ family protein [Sulfurimonadaceae bacterium]